ncbi:MAG: serine/threonine-protein phosphatase [Holophagales bacterium]|nr:serine/threonine-protein phosphatase [Holophagales bacterium]MBK9964342.1 serine/threonine-protein phosphatase [Holophagales bacterium]
MDGTRVRVAGLSEVGRVRKINEDAFVVTDLATGRPLDPADETGELEVGPRGVLLALSDGMGGHAAGEVASALVLDALRASLAGAPEAEPVEATVTTAIDSANSEVRRNAAEDGKRGMGATLTAVLLRATEAFVVEVGDSRAYLLRGEALRQLTRDQTLVQLLVETGALSAEEARTSSRKNILLQAVGHADELKIAISRLKLRRGDRFLLCSDGLSNGMNDDELGRLLAGDEPAAACRRLVDLANERGGSDNLTAVVAHVKGDGLPEATPAESIAQTLDVIREFPLPG